jgi:hypothetical protein
VYFTPLPVSARFLTSYIVSQPQNPKRNGNQAFDVAVIGWADPGKGGFGFLDTTKDFDRTESLCLTDI